MAHYNYWGDAKYESTNVHAFDDLTSQTSKQKALWLSQLTTDLFGQWKKSKDEMIKLYITGNMLPIKEKEIEAVEVEE